MIKYEEKLGGASSYVLDYKEKNLYNCRKQLAKLIKCNIHEIAITANTTEGINIAANGLKLQKDDEIIMMMKNMFLALYLG